MRFGNEPHFSMRSLIDAFNTQFIRLHERSVGFVREIDSGNLFLRPYGIASELTVVTIGENILRSAAMVELAFGGITTRLWDDPFEWTLPEALSTGDKIIEYLNEVEATRQLGFGYFPEDSALARTIPAPRELRTIASIMLDTVAKAENYQGRAFSIYQMIQGGKLPRL